MEEQEVHAGNKGKAQQHDAPKRRIAIVEPVARKIAKVKQPENAVEAEVRVVEEFPDEYGDDGGHQHGQHEGDAHGARPAAVAHVKEQQRRQQREKAAVEHREDADDHLIAEGEPEHLVAEQRLEVLKADEVGLKRGRCHLVRQRNAEGDAHGKVEKDGQRDKRGRQKDVWQTFSQKFSSHIAPLSRAALFRGKGARCPSPPQDNTFVPIFPVRQVRGSRS